ncbi:hypothetical protein ABT095_09100 [Kitasatospora sp. NPDC002227]
MSRATVAKAAAVLGLALAALLPVAAANTTAAPAARHTTAAPSPADMIWQ